MVEAIHIETSSGSTQVHTGGEGPPLLLVHGGWGGAGMHWAPVWDALAERHRVVAPELPGVGDRSLPTLENIAAYARFLSEVLQALEVARADVVGNSFGAVVGWHFASTQPARTRSLVLVDGGPMPVLPAPIRRLLRLRQVDRLARAGFARSAYSPATLGRAFADPGKAPPQLLRVLHRRGPPPPIFDLLMHVSRIGERPPPAPGCPLLVLWGAEDRLSGTRVADAERLKARTPGAELVVVPNAGHLPQVEQPEAFVAALEDFIARRVAASTAPSVEAHA